MRGSVRLSGALARFRGAGVGMRSIGLTGGIASGKSTVVSALGELGAETIDADRLGHATYEPGTETFRAVVAAFGDELVAEDGTIDRAVLGRKVFGKPEEMKRLTDIVWPGIRALAAAELDRLKAAGAGVAVLEAAVLIEAEWQDLVDEVWVVSVSREAARERLMARNQLSAEQADARIDSQIGNEERLAHADVVIDTDCPLAEVQERVRRAWDELSGRIG